MTKRQKRGTSKQSSKKLSNEADRACSTPLHTTDQQGEDDDDESEDEGGKTVATKDNKRPKLNRAGIG